MKPISPPDPTPIWPRGHVQALLDTVLVTPPTRAALSARLARRPAPPAHLTAAQCATLHAVCARLIPQPDPRRRIDLAGLIDARLAAGEGDGWRYDVLPPDGEAHRHGLDALDASAETLGGARFDRLDEAAKDWLLSLCQRGELGGASWNGLPCGRWFEELLAEATELYYAHPVRPGGDRLRRLRRRGGLERDRAGSAGSARTRCRLFACREAS